MIIFRGYIEEELDERVNIICVLAYFLKRWLRASTIASLDYDALVQHHRALRPTPFQYSSHDVPKPVNSRRQ